MPTSDHSRFWIASEVVVALAAVAVPWSLGGAPAWTAGLVFGLGWLALVLWLIGAGRNHRRLGFHPVLALPVAAAALAALQLIPLPPWLLERLSAPGSQLRDFALLPLGLSAWRSISMDPPSTARALARIVGLGSLLFVALELSRRAVVRRRLLSVVALTGVSVAVCGFGHLLASADTLFGAYRFYAGSAMLTPFGNTNHLAAFLAFSATVALGLSLEAPSKEDSVGWGVAALTCGVGVFLSLSRGGIATFAATWLVVGLVHVSRRAVGGWRPVMPFAAMAATAVFAGLLAFEQLLERAESVSSVAKLSTTKIDLWPMLARGVMPHWPMGMGLGAFEVAFSPFQVEQLDVTFTHPENIALQWANEAGLIVTVLMGLGGAWLVARTWRDTSADTLRRTALVGLLGVVLHDLFDFAFELNALAVAATVVAGVVCSPGAARHPRISVHRRGLVFGTAVGAAGAAALLLGFPTHAAAEEQLSQAVERGSSSEGVRQLAQRLIRRHPADWVLYAAMAQDAARRGDPRDALAWVNRVLLLRPADARSHETAAQALLRLNRPLQALAELKTAWSLGATGTLELGLAIASKEGALDRVLLDKVGHLSDAYRLLRAKARLADVQKLLEAAQAMPPSDDVRAEARMLRIIHRAELGEPKDALAALDELSEEEQAAPNFALARVNLLLKLGRSEDAEQFLERLAAKVPNNLELAFRLTELYESQGRRGAARETLERVRPYAGTTWARSTIFQKQAALWVQDERWGKALEALQTAARLEPARPDLHYRMAEIYEGMGSAHSALDEVRRGRLLDTPEGARSKDAWLERLSKVP